MSSKRWISMALVLILLVCLTGVEAMAVQTGEGVITGRQEAQMTTQMVTAAAETGGPALAPGNHERWIDRIDQLPDYASEFYTWLENNACLGGALADPSKGQVIEGSSGEKDTYIYLFHTIEGSASFTYTGSNHATAAQNAVLNDLGDAHIIAVNYATAVYGAFDRDHPEVFWLSGSSLYGYSVPYDYSYFAGKGTVTYSVELYFFLQDPDFDLRNADYQDTAALSEAMAVQEQRVEEILADCPDTGAYDQLYYLNRVLTEINAYNSQVAAGNQDAASKDAWKGISALKGSTGEEGPVCEAYARAMKILCDRLEIPCVLVEGPAKTTADGTAVAHMWNNVQLEGSWYAIDSTWNDPYSFSLPEVACTGLENEDWMLLGSNSLVGELTFGQSHTVTNYTTQDSLCYTNGPVLSDEAYVPSMTVPTLTLQYPTLTFEDVITMNVYYQAQDLEDVVDMGLITYTTQVDSWSLDTAQAVIPGYTWNESKQLYMVSTDGIPAKDMSDTLWFAVYAQLADGTYTYSRLVSYSPTDYAYTLLDSADTSVKQLMVAMLNYGAQAQTFFNYRTDALMNASLTAEQQSSIESYRADMMAAVDTPSAEKAANFQRTATGFDSRYPSISFEGAFCINYYCSPSFTPAGELLMYYWNQGAYDAAEVLTVDNATGVLTMEADTDRYAAAIEGIAAKDLDKGVFVAFVYTDGDAQYCSGILGYSIGAYCVDQAATGAAISPFAAATAVYGYYAKQTFVTSHI